MLVMVVVAIPPCAEGEVRVKAEDFADVCVEGQ